MQMTTNNPLIIEAKDGRSYYSTDHVGRAVIVVAIVPAMLCKCSDKCNAFGSSGSSATLCVVGWTWWHVTHHNHRQVADIDSKLHRRRTDKYVRLTFAELLLVLLTRFSIKLPTMFMW